MFPDSLNDSKIEQCRFLSCHSRSLVVDPAMALAGGGMGNRNARRAAKKKDKKGGGGGGMGFGAR